MKNKIFLAIILILGFQVFLINAQDAAYSPSKKNALISLFNEGIKDIKEGKISSAMQKFEAAINLQPRTMDEYKAQIGSLENLFVYSLQNNDIPKQNNYSKMLVRAFSDAFDLARVSAEPSDQAFKEKFALILESMITHNGAYTNLANVQRTIILSPEIKDYLQNKRKDYLSALSKKGKDEIKALNLNDALKLIPTAISKVEEAEKSLLAVKEIMVVAESAKRAINSEQSNRIEQLKNKAFGLYSEAFQQLLTASNLRNDIPNVEYHLALMYLKGLGVDKDIQLAQKHINLADACKKSSTSDLIKNIEELKNQIDGLISANEGLTFYLKSREASFKPEDKLKLKQEAFKRFEKASTIYPKIFNVEITLAQMCLNADGTKKDFPRAKGHAQLAKNMAADQKEKDFCNNLMEEIDAAALKEQQAKLPKGPDYDNRHALGRVFGVQASSESTDNSEQEEDPYKVDWFARLFGTSRPVGTTKPSIAELALNDQEQGSAQANSASSARPPSQTNRRSFVASLFGKSPQGKNA